MVTVRQIEKLWNAQNYARLVGEMFAGRPEASPRLENEFSPTGNDTNNEAVNSRGVTPRAPAECSTNVPTLSASAAALLRLDELSQSHVPLYARLLRLILARQDSDGGWGDPLTTALCLRALIASRGQGLAIDRGMNYLAQLQKPEGIWPKAPIRRLEGDPFVSAFIMLQLGCDERFQKAVRFDGAIKWFVTNTLVLDAETRRLWGHAVIRCRSLKIARAHEPVLTWS